MSNLLHFKSLGKDSCGRLFAKHVFAVTHKVDRNRCMTVVVGANGNNVYIVVAEKLLVIIHSLAAAVGLNSIVGALGNNITKIAYLNIVKLKIARYV